MTDTTSAKLVEELRDERRLMQGDGLAALISTASRAADHIEALEALLPVPTKALSRAPTIERDGQLVSAIYGMIGGTDDLWDAPDEDAYQTAVMGLSERIAGLLSSPTEGRMREALNYIAKTWPDSFAARHARATILKATQP